VNRILGTVLSRLALFVPGGSHVRPRIQRWRGVSVGNNVWIGLYVYIDNLHPEALTIGDNCTIGIRTSIITHFYWGPRQRASNGRVVIEDNVFVGPHCVILPNVTIGQGAVIQAGSVVTRSVPPGTFWGPPPAGPLGVVTVPLTSDHGFAAFLRGVRPMPSEPAGSAAPVVSPADPEQ
jgi:acetyltransferase-like isoleucine patch superfamily enzyme